MSDPFSEFSGKLAFLASVLNYVDNISDHFDFLQRHVICFILMRFVNSGGLKGSFFVERIIFAEILIMPYSGLAFVGEADHVGVDVKGTDRMVEKVVSLKSSVQNIKRLIKR